MTVTYREYSEDKKSFFEKHKYDYRVETSSMDEYDRYHKVYSFKDGSQWYETMSPEYVREIIDVKHVKVEVEVKMFKTEYWNSEQESKYYYEKY